MRTPEEIANDIVNNWKHDPYPLIKEIAAAITTERDYAKGFKDQLSTFYGQKKLQDVAATYAKVLGIEQERAFIAGAYWLTQRLSSILFMIPFDETPQNSGFLENMRQMKSDEFWETLRKVLEVAENDQKPA